ncbi:hypothetical protein L798_13290 [Zootermopsis nevadensis]|uniref:Uncharacterized protein n=1 Tax=Zootermopsis nevadensis TaxID=136037 RepID=A0A067QTW7_ZOONE|nr:hypothetical protein L798_13290 [Zootermopsis nevadensis]
MWMTADPAYIVGPDGEAHQTKVLTSLTDILGTRHTTLNSLPHSCNKEARLNLLLPTSLTLSFQWE